MRRGAPNWPRGWRNRAHATAFDAMRRLLGDPALSDATAREPALPPGTAARPVRRRATLRTRAGRGLLTAAAACAALAVVLPMGWRLLAPAPVERQVYASATGARRDARLPDGSALSLDAASRLAIAFSGDARDLDLLAGAARFDVRHDVGRPFRVTTPDAAMTALGTNFSVERLPGASVLRVFRGRVRLDVAGHAPVVVAAGGAASVARGRIALDRFDATARAAWQDAWLDAGALPLADALARLQRYSPRPLRLADPSLGRLTLTGRFRLDTPERSAALIATLFDLSAARQGDALCLSSPTLSALRAAPAAGDMIVAAAASAVVSRGA